MTVLPRVNAKNRNEFTAVRAKESHGCAVCELQD
jgi:hypothetical protein